MHCFKFLDNLTGIAEQVQDKLTGATYIVAESRMSVLPSKKSKSDASNGPAQDAKPTSKGSSKEKVKGGKDTGSYELLEKVSGSSLVGMK